MKDANEDCGEKPSVCNTQKSIDNVRAGAQQNEPNNQKEKKLELADDLGVEGDLKEESCETKKQ